MIQRVETKRKLAAPRLLVTLAVALLLGGCAILPERGGEPQQWRLVAPDPTVEGNDIREPVIVRLIETRAASAIDRRDMAYSRGRQSLAYYRDNRWASPPGVMLNEIIDETLSTRSWVRTVIRGSARVPADLSLYCEIQRLEHQLGPGELTPPGQVQMKVACSWYRASERQLVEAMVFDETLELATNNAARYAEGAQALVDRFMTRLVAQGATLAATTSSLPPETD
ncbi:ABC-type transport auxiliary lipoprotein family protein [Guyparkeria halophila]|uniref:ABC-type transport auxiliary lipoprotein family protein n=1 Tax=Guyparkeria halophila TaxID=47960 RepID=A0ABZ0YVU5_9GAMM|nr:ABC-type transport auxiliary lipoprotein family protein [Guyparkeria halophila]WQH15305.1 ABC-type transport auxiliary lipoprotein family protein [Guyparkeria halophila]